MIGFLTGLQDDTNPVPLMVTGAGLHGGCARNRAMLAQLSPAVDADRIRPAIDRVFDFEAVRDAYDYQKRGAFGKVVIKI